MQSISDQIHIHKVILIQKKTVIVPKAEEKLSQTTLLLNYKSAHLLFFIYEN